MIEIDARGLACPGPVLQTKNTIEKQDSDAIRVIVDNTASQQNVQRFLESQGYQTRLEQQGDDYLILGDNDSVPEPQPKTAAGDSSADRKIMVMCASDRMGSGDDRLGEKLMVSFIKTIKEMGEDLWRIVLVNNGVKLAIDGSDVLEDLLAYEKAGIKILVCGTCLTYFDLLEAKKVGETTNMLDIVTSMQLADSVIQP